jgi:hypothetical protein
MVHISLLLLCTSDCGYQQTYAFHADWGEPWLFMHIKLCILLSEKPAFGDILGLLKGWISFSGLS